MCLKEGRASMAEIADHIKPIKEGGARLDINNLQSLCRSCHNKKHG
jgi:5-methylcytosine-specific restriction protein A